jgi:hypothetical protein
VALVLGSGPNRVPQIQIILSDIVVFVIGIVLTRGGFLAFGSMAHSVVYRLTIFGTFFLSYFQLQGILPAVSSRSFDAEIFAIDQSFFGFEPALAWDRFVNPATTEWFAFFYFGYFFMLIAHIIPFLVAGRDKRLTARFALGVYMVFCIAHVLYMVVPGYGPYRYLANQFENPLDGGLFWNLVTQAVSSSGAQKDIFPSLHTGVPTYFVLFSIRHRHLAPFKYTWYFAAFFASQIIIATMFLRWHYLIDICAGITLAAGCVVLSTYLEEWESARRGKLGVPPVFDEPPLFRKAS